MFISACFVMLLLASSLRAASATEDLAIELNVLSVEAELNISPRFLIFDDIIHDMVINITGSVAQDLGSVGNVSILYPRGLKISQIMIDPPDSNSSISFFNEFLNEVKVSLPGATRRFTIILTTTFDGDSFFMRNTASIPLIRVRLDVPPFVPTAYTIVIPKEDGIGITNISGTDIFQIERNDLEFHAFLNPTSSVAILYERDGRFFLGLLIIGAILSSSLGIFMVASKAGINFGATPSMITPRVKNISKTFRSRTPSKTILTLYVTVAIFMLALSLATGPSPTPKVFVSATPSRAETIIESINSPGFDFITAGEGQGAFDVMASLGAYDAAIIADFIPGFSGEQALPGLGALRNIYILEEDAPEEFTETALRIWAPRVTLLDDPSELTRVLRIQDRNPNLLGLSISESTFRFNLAVLGILSFLIVFLATAFLATRIIESSHTSSLASLTEAITYSVMIFMFTQMVYMASAVLLKVPLGLHAGGGSSDLTAVGVLGFGGGSRPRWLAGILGFAVGALITPMGRMKFDKNVFLALLIAGSFMIINPLPSGIFFHQVLTSFTTSFSSTGTDAAIFQIKGFIGSIGDFWTSNFTSSYFIQRGVPLLYAGAIIFSFYPRSGKFVGTIILLASSFVGSYGFMRLADQVPVKSIASIPPGLILGFMIIPLIIGLNFIESFIRSRIKR